MSENRSPSAMELAIIALKPQGSGEEVELTVSISNGEHSEYRVLTVGAKLLFELGNIGPSTLPYVLNEEKFDRLEYAERLWGAVKRGLKLLSYTDSTKRRLADKLIERGFERELAFDAAEYIEALGYISEGRQLEKEVRTLTSKGYGRTRIKQELYRRGYSRETLECALEDALAEVDFDEILRNALRKKCRTDRLEDAKYRESLIAAMYRLGHSPSDTRTAIAELREDE